MTVCVGGGGVRGTWGVANVWDLDKSDGCGERLMGRGNGRNCIIDI